MILGVYLFKLNLFWVGVGFGVYGVCGANDSRSLIGSNQDIRGLLALKINEIRLTKMACFSFLMNSLGVAVGFAAKFK